MDVFELRRGHDRNRKPLRLVASPHAFAVRFLDPISGAQSARAALRLPFRLDRSLRMRSEASPAGLVVFEVTPDSGSRDLPGMTDAVEEYRDTAMNVIRSRANSKEYRIRSCYHTYRRADAGETRPDAELIPSGALFLEFHSKVAEAQHRELFEHYHLLVDREIPYQRGAYVVSVTQATGANPVKLARTLLALTFEVEGKSIPIFDYAEPLFHRNRKTHVIPRSAAFPFQWHLRNDGLAGGRTGVDIGAAQAWDTSLGHPEVSIAVIDDAFDLAASRIEPERVMAPLNANDRSERVAPRPGGGEWHGTSVLGLIGASHAGNGVCGLAPHCPVIPIKLDPLVDDDAEARAFDHAVSQGAAVINCSWGPYDNATADRWPMPRLTELAIQNAYRQRTAIVFAAGNGAEDVRLDGYASHPCVIAVSATTDEDERAYYSDYGERVWVCAPSSGGKAGIVTSDAEDGGYNPLGNYTTRFGGTSAAAPLVAGTIALMQSAYLEANGKLNPRTHRLTVEEVKGILRRHSRAFKAPPKDFSDYWDQDKVISTQARGRDQHSWTFGYGRLDAAACVRAAQEWKADERHGNLLLELQETAPPVRREPKPRRRVQVGPRAGTRWRFELPDHVVGDPMSIFHTAREKDMKPEHKSRFASGEHLWLGCEGFKQACITLGLDYARHFATFARNIPAGRERFSYGEIVALSGDFYGSPEELFYERPSWLSWAYESNDISDLKGYMAEEVKVIAKQMAGEAIEYPDHNIVFWWNAKNYVELAKKNEPHFGWHNMIRYCNVHRWALDIAKRASRATDEGRADLFRKAVFVNGFADHFLTDAFAAGHIRVPRRQIREWAPTVGLSDTAAGFLSKLLHDQDGHRSTVHAGPDESSRDRQDGLHVKNAANVEWWTRCDGQLFIEAERADPVIAQPVEAVKQSVLELFAAYMNNELPNGIYRASLHVPFPHPDETGLSAKFQATDSATIQRWVKEAPIYAFGMNEKNIKKLFAALPRLMSEFRKEVAGTAARGAYGTLLPKAYIEAFKRIE